MEFGMTHDDIIRLARGAGWNMEWGGTTIEQVIAFAAGVSAAEREACARVCDALAEQDTVTNYYRVAALAIRARGDA